MTFLVIKTKPSLLFVTRKKHQPHFKKIDSTYVPNDTYPFSVSFAFHFKSQRV